MFKQMKVKVNKILRSSSRFVVCAILPRDSSRVGEYLLVVSVNKNLLCNRSMPLAFKVLILSILTIIFDRKEI